MPLAPRVRTPASGGSDIKVRGPPRPHAGNVGSATSTQAATTVELSEAMSTPKPGENVPLPGRGLTEDVTRVRLREEGPNELPEPERRSPFGLLWDVLSEPMFALLFGAALLYLLFGEPRDALVLGASAVVVVALDFYQEHRAEQALEALRILTVPEVVVLRDGQRRTVRAGEVVRGDWVALAEGDRVVADGVVRAGNGLLVDESLLTGESVPVRKTVGGPDTLWARPGGEDLPFVYAQTLVIRGQGWVEIRATGRRTETSRIASTLAGVETGTPLSRTQTRPLILGIAALAVLLTTLLAVIVGLRTGNWIVGLLAGAALAIGLVPEEIPVVTTSTLCSGRVGWRRDESSSAASARFPRSDV